jgi:FG-GAP-like repeat/Fibronectin type III domain
MQTLGRVLRTASLVSALVCLSGSVAQTASVTLVWNRNPEANIAGYLVSWGAASQQYAATIDVGNQVSYVFSEPDPTRKYYFAVRAYNIDGLVSPYSAEASSTPGGHAPIRVPSGDYDGDGKADLTVYRPATGTWFTRHSSTNYGTSAAFQWGLNGDIPVAGDYDGDAKADFAVLRPATGEWFIRLSSTSYATSAVFQWGLPGDVPVPGDFDGDGKTDLAVFRPSDGVWYIRQSSTTFTTFVAYQWGLKGDVAVPGDYDGDGKTDIAVYRPVNGVWYIRQSPYLAILMATAETT